MHSIRQAIPRAVAGLACGTLVSGCGLFQGSPKPEMTRLPKDQPVVITYPATFRGTYLYAASGHIVECSEPPPDVSLNVIATLNANGKLAVPARASASVGAAISNSATTTELAGRTQLILLTRELLFRLCELSMTHPDISAPELTNMYETVLDQISKLSTAEVNYSEAAKAQAQAKYAQVVGVQRSLAQQIVDLFSTNGTFDVDRWNKFVSSTIKTSSDKTIAPLANGLAAFTDGNSLVAYLSGLSKTALNQLLAVAGQWSANQSSNNSSKSGGKP